MNKFILKLIAYLINAHHKARLRSLKLKYKGTNVKILKGFDFGYPENLVIEDNVLIGINTFINAQGGVTIKSGICFGPNCLIFSVNHNIINREYLPYDDVVIKKSVVIGENSWIGANVSIMPGVELGEGCIVAGGAVVTKSFPMLSLIGGNPAKLIRELDLDSYLALKKDNKIYNYHFQK